jgi:hypothetical protein
VRGAARIFVWAALLGAAACGRDPDGGATLPEVQPLPVAAGAGSGQPFLAQAADGTVVLSWLEPIADQMRLRAAVLAAGAWSEPRTVAQGADLFVNWADVPSVVPLTAERWVAHWLVLVAGSYGAYDVVTAVSGDAGTTWSAPVTLHDDGTQTEHGFATLFPWGETIGAVWLDGRQLAEWSFDRPDELLGVSLRFARLSGDGRMLERGEIDPLACDCCQTDVAIAAGQPIVIYRDRSEAEIRDVVVRRYDGSAWLEAVDLGRENWFIEGCPVNGPAIAARGADVAAAWFTAADGRPSVRFTRSTDGGSSFAAPLDIDTDGAFGQVGVAILDDATAVVSWWRRAPGAGTVLAARAVGRRGELSPVQTIAASGAAQPLDVPEIVAVGDTLIFAWTDFADGGRVLSAAVYDTPN